MSSYPAKTWRDLKNIHLLANQEGKLLIWTKIFVAPSGFENQAPYLVGVVELKNGQRITAQIVDCQEQDLSVGQKVMTVIRKLGQAKESEVIEYTAKVKPI